jgi:uncharacterized protein (TIGR03066 family)
MRSVVVAGVTFLAVGLTAAAGPVEAGKLLGAWELTKVEGQATAPHWRVEFLKGGKLRMTAQKRGEELKLEGTYALKKDRLTLTVQVDGKTVDTKTVTVQTLTGEVLVFLDTNKKMEFKRAK